MITNDQLAQIRADVQEARQDYADGYEKLYKQVPALCAWIELLLSDRAQLEHQLAHSYPVPQDTAFSVRSPL